LFGGTEKNREKHQSCWLVCQLRYKSRTRSIPSSFAVHLIIIFSFHSLLLSLCGTWDCHEALPLDSVYLRLVLLLASSFFHPSVVPILLFFSSFLVYASSWYPKGFCLMHVVLLYFVVYVVYGQSNAIVFPFCCCLVGVCSVFCHNSSFGILSSHLVLKIHCRHRCTNTWSELLTHVVIFQ
jgi:hypothetical protein